MVLNVGLCILRVKTRLRPKSEDYGIHINALTGSVLVMCLKLTDFHNKVFNKALKLLFNVVLFSKQKAGCDARHGIEGGTWFNSTIGNA
jgi:hypothetical protein